MANCTNCDCDICDCDSRDFVKLKRRDICLMCPKHCPPNGVTVPKQTVIELFDLVEAINKTKYLSKQHKELMTRYYTLKNEICGVKAEE